MKQLLAMPMDAWPDREIAIAARFISAARHPDGHTFSGLSPLEINVLHVLGIRRAVVTEWDDDIFAGIDSAVLVRLPERRQR